MWRIRHRTALSAAIALLTSCGTSVPRLFTPNPSATCDEIDPATAARGYIWYITAGFPFGQLTDRTPAGTYVAVLSVGQTAPLAVEAHIAAPAECTHLITGSTWTTSDASVAAIQSTGRNTGVLTALAPGEITVTVQAFFSGGSVAESSMLAPGPYQVRAVRVVR